MSFTFILDLKDKILSFVGTVLSVFSTSIGELLGSQPSGFLPQSFLDMTLLDFVLQGGIMFIVIYTLVKWLVPFLE